MDAQRPGDEITDSALDRELQAMLGVEPSPEFVARTRTRIADEAANARRWFGVRTAIAPLAAVVAVVIVTIVAHYDSGRVSEPANSLAVPVRRPLAGTGAADGVGTLVSVPRDRQVRRGDAAAVGHPQAAAVDRRPSATPDASVPTAAAAESEVLIDWREAAALRALVLGMRDGRVDLAPVLNASQPGVMELPPMVDIQIPEITIDPIAPAGGEQGVAK